MIKQLLLPLAGVAAFIIIVGLLVNNSANIKIPGLLNPVATAVPAKTIKVGSVTMQVEIANTAEARTRGLSGRTSLTGNTGMLFIFDPTDTHPGFWMKGMLFPLDIVWIKAGNVIKIDKNAPPPSAGTPDSALKVYVPGQVINNVLEVRGGFSDANGISVGSKVDLSGI